MYFLVSHDKFLQSNEHVKASKKCCTSLFKIYKIYSICFPDKIWIKLIKIFVISDIRRTALCIAKKEDDNDTIT